MTAATISGVTTTPSAVDAACSGAIAPSCCCWSAWEAACGSEAASGGRAPLAGVLAPLKFSSTGSVAWLGAADWIGSGHWAGGGGRDASAAAFSADAEGELSPAEMAVESVEQQSIPALAAAAPGREPRCAGSSHFGWLVKQPPFYAC